MKRGGTQGLLLCWISSDLPTQPCWYSSQPCTSSTGTDSDQRTVAACSQQSSTEDVAELTSEPSTGGASYQSWAEHRISVRVVIWQPQQHCLSLLSHRGKEQLEMAQMNPQKHGDTPAEQRHRGSVLCRNQKVF